MSSVVVGAGVVRVRTARRADAHALSGLLAELGYRQTAAELRPRIEDMADSETDTVLVAELDGLVAGVVSLHVTPFFNEGRSRGRITALVVGQSQRGLGVGRSLLDAVEAAAARRGCAAVELTSSAHRLEAHRFYVIAGYLDLPHRFLKHLGAGNDHMVTGPDRGIVPE